MKTTKGTISLLLERYAYPRKSAPLEVPGYIVGDIGVHRREFWHDGEAPSLSDNPARNSWTVSHIPTGSTLERMLPARLKGLRAARKKDLEQWARGVQEACPAFFEATRKLERGQVLPETEENFALVREALNKSQAL